MQDVTLLKVPVPSNRRGEGQAAHVAAVAVVAAARPIGESTLEVLLDDVVPQLAGVVGGKGAMHALVASGQGQLQQRWGRHDRDLQVLNIQRGEKDLTIAVEDDKVCPAFTPGFQRSY